MRGVACGRFGLVRVDWANSMCGFRAGLGVLWGWLGGALGLAWWCLGAGFGVAVCCVVTTCLRFQRVLGWRGLCGGIATIGAALRRVVGVSGVYGRKTPRVIAWKGQRRVPFRWQCWSSLRCRCLAVVVWFVFVGGLGGIATIGAALRRVAGVSGVYGRKTPRVLAQSAVHLGEIRVTWGVWGVVDYGLGALVRGEAVSAGGVLGTSGLRACCRDDRAHCRRLSRGAAREGGASWCVLVTYFCAAAGEVLPRMVRLLCGGIGWVSCARVLVCSCARVLVCSCARWDHRPRCRSGSPDAAFPQPPKVFTSAPYTSGGASWQPRSCVVVVS